jgi:RNA polymerase sigma-70 factor, ECF subfamily
MINLRTTLECHMTGLRRYAMSLVRDPTESDELVQECMLRALSNSHVWPRVRDARAYLFTVLHHVYVDYRREQRRMGPQVPVEETAGQLPTPPSQFKQVELQEMARALSALPKEQREVVLLVALDGCSYQEVSDKLRIPVGTVMSRLFRAREALRRMTNGEATAPRRRRASLPIPPVTIAQAAAAPSVG